LKLLVVDVHGNFETKTDVVIFRCLPVHDTYLSLLVKNVMLLFPYCLGVNLG